MFLLYGLLHVESSKDVCLTSVAIDLVEGVLERFARGVVKAPRWRGWSLLLLLELGGRPDEYAKKHLIVGLRLPG